VHREHPLREPRLELAEREPDPHRVARVREPDDPLDAPAHVQRAEHPQERPPERPPRAPHPPRAPPLGGLLLLLSLGCALLRPRRLLRRLLLTPRPPRLRRLRARPPYPHP